MKIKAFIQTEVEDNPIKSSPLCGICSYRHWAKVCESENLPYLIGQQAEKNYSYKLNALGFPIAAEGLCVTEHMHCEAKKSSKSNANRAVQIRLAWLYFVQGRTNKSWYLFCVIQSPLKLSLFETGRPVSNFTSVSLNLPFCIPRSGWHKKVWKDGESQIYFCQPPPTSTCLEKKWMW